MRIVFFGTPAFAVPSLQALTASDHQVVGVVTQPDRARGRGRKVSFSAVKAAAVSLGIPVMQPERLLDEGFVSGLTQLRPDLGVVAAYGKILPVAVLDLPRLGMINVHASLLPRWRGAAPIHRAIIAGDERTGVTIMRVVKALDAGPMLAAAETTIDPAETSGELEERLARTGAALLLQTVDRLSAGAVAETAQDESHVTYAHRLVRTDGAVDFSQAAHAVHNRIRGLQPWPLVSVTLHEKRLMLLKSEALPAEHCDAVPGSVVRIEPDGLVVATGEGALRLSRVQLEGRQPVAMRDFLNGHRVAVGDRLVSSSPAGT